MAAFGEYFRQVKAPPPETMTGFVDALGGPGRGGGTRAAAGILGITQREVQRVVKGERGQGGQTRSLNTANRVKMRAFMREETKNLVDPAVIRRRGITVTLYRGDFRMNSPKRGGVDERLNRAIDSPVHITGAEMGEMLDELEREERNEDELQNLFNEAFFRAYFGAEDSNAMDNVSALVWHVGKDAKAYSTGG